jgi:O-methyltransferase
MILIKNNDSNASFGDKLWRGIEGAFAKGNRAFLFWGLNETTVSLLDKMADSGLQHYVVGVVDDKIRSDMKVAQQYAVFQTDSVRNLEADTLVITLDEDKELALRAYANLTGRLPHVIAAGTGHMNFRDQIYEEIVSSCSVTPRAGGYRDMLVHLYQTIAYLSKRKLKGSVAEFGVYKGGTTVFMAKVLQRFGLNCKIYAFDTFGGFPPRRTMFDLYDDPHDAFSDFDSVCDYCKPYNIELVRGDICDTYHRIDSIPLILSFFDTDNYSPTRAALHVVYRQTASGGILVFDHYYCDERWLYTIGERMAISEVLREKEVLNFHGTGIFLKA